MQRIEIAIPIFVILLVCLSFLSTEQKIDAQSTSQLECGDIVEGEFLEDVEDIRYIIDANAGDQLSLAVDPFGEFLETRIVLYGPTGQEVTATYGGNTAYPNTVPEPVLNTGELSANGTYTVEIRNYSWPDDPEGVGVFLLSIECTLRDGTMIAAGASASDETTTSPPDASTSSTFSGFGFPGLAAVDFTGGIEIPISRGLPLTVPLGSDVALYTYEASDGETATLNVSRVSGDISIGVTVIKSDTNEIVFFGAMPASNNLSIDLEFPSSGSYAIGLFRVDTVERVGTSGAVQLTLE